MPLNQIKKYNALLDILGLSPHNRTISLKSIFDRDISNNANFKFRAKQITPTPLDGEITMETLFRHLTTVMVDKKTKKREYDVHRSQRLHWVKHHINETKKDNMLVYSVKEPDGFRTYVYDKDENYVVVLEPLRNKEEYYLLSAYEIVLPSIVLIFLFNNFYKNPNSSFASSLIIEISHGGSNVIIAFTSLTSSNSIIFISTSRGIWSATGQLGAVSVISTTTSLLSATVISYIRPSSTMFTGISGSKTSFSFS